MFHISSRGFTLLEVLISMLLLSILLLEQDGVELFALHKNLNTYYASMAEQQLRNLEQRLQMLGASHGVEEQVGLWNEENREVLPQGQGEVSGGYPRYRVRLFWGENSAAYLSEELVL